MTALTILLVAAALAFGVARFTSIPPIPLLILAGFVAALPLDLDTDILGDALILGVSVLVFVAGVELNPDRVGRQKRVAISVGGLQFAVLGAVGVAAGHLLGLGLEGSLYLGLALTASSTLVVVRILQQRQQLFEPVGRMITGVLLLQDLLLILLIPVVTRLPDGAAAVGIGLGSTLALVALTMGIQHWIAPFVLRRLAFDDESLLLLVLTFLFAFIGLCVWLELPLVVGAFLAGVALSAFPVNALARGQLNSISKFFNALFFTALGAFLPFPTIEILVQAVLLTGVVLVVTPPLVASLAERAGMSARPALGGGLVLSQTSEFSLVVGLQAVALGQIADVTFSVIVWVTVLSMTLTPFLATDRVVWSLLRFHRTRRTNPREDVPVDHLVLAGCGRSGREILELLRIGPHRILAVDEDPATIDWLREAGVDAVRGDVTDPSVLRDAGVDRARIVISTIRRTRDNELLLKRTAERTPAFIRTFESADAEWVEARGGRPVLFSEAAAEEFMEWFQTEFLAENS